MKYWDERLEICSKCDHYGGWVCNKCGCILAIKTRIPIAECPINKWGKVETNGKDYTNYE